MVSIMPRTARAIERKGLDQELHIALIDTDLDEQERAFAQHAVSVNEKLDKIAAGNTWLLRTVGAGFVSFFVLAATALLTHLFR